MCGLSYVSHGLFSVSPGLTVCGVSDTSHGILYVSPDQNMYPMEYFLFYQVSRHEFVRHFPPSGQQVCDLSDGCHRVFLVSAGQGVYDLSMPMDHS